MLALNGQIDEIASQTSLPFVVKEKLFFFLIALAHQLDQFNLTSSLSLT